MKNADGRSPRAQNYGRQGTGRGVWSTLAIVAVLGLSSCAVASTSSSSDGATAVASSPAPTPTPTPTAVATAIAATSATSAAPTAAPPSTTAAPAPTAAAATTASAPAGVATPNPSLTPGETFAAATTAQICRSGYASSVRHVELTQYHQVYAEYAVAYPEPSGTYELDHLIPLELGGDNANANLWPEPASPAPGFHQKDQFENAMHALVCSGRLDLAQAQKEIATNWYAAYVHYVSG